MRTQSWYLFQLVTVGFLLSLNWLADRLFRNLYPGYSGWKRLLFWCCAVLSILIYTLARTALFREVGAESNLKYIMYILVIWDISLVGILLSWPICWGATRVLHQSEPDLGRRAFLGRSLGLATALSCSGAIGGVVAAEAGLVVRKKVLAFANLPPALEGFRVVQVSDSHLGLFFSLSRWQEVLERIKAEQPDLLLLTGDIIDDLELLPEALAMLAALRPSITCGMYACLGNHEYFRNVSTVRRAFAVAGVPLLSNESRRLVKGTGELYLLAADYPQTRNPLERSAVCREFTTQAMADVPKNSFSLFMAHHPDFINEGFQRGIPLTVAGHTHGAQIGWGERSLFEGAFSYTRGLYQQGDSYGFVSSGVGHWMPFRLACPPEIVTFTLMRSQ